MAHARNVARPAKLARRDELVQRFHFQAPAQLRAARCGSGVATAHWCHSLTPHMALTHSLGVEHAKPVE